MTPDSFEGAIFKSAPCSHDIGQKQGDRRPIFRVIIFEAVLMSLRLRTGRGPLHDIGPNEGGWWPVLGVDFYSGGCLGLARGFRSSPAILLPAKSRAVFTSGSPAGSKGSTCLWFQATGRWPSEARSLGSLVVLRTPKTAA